MLPQSWRKRMQHAWYAHELLRRLRDAGVRLPTGNYSSIEGVDEVVLKHQEKLVDVFVTHWGKGHHTVCRSPDRCNCYILDGHMKCRRITCARLGPALAEPGCRDFKVSFMHASHALPCVYKTPLPLIYEWAGLTRGAEVVKHTLSSLDSAPQAQEGPTPRPRCSQMRAHRAASLPQVQPPSVLNCTTHTSRGLRCISESPTARVRRTRQVSSWSERREART